MRVSKDVYYLEVAKAVASRSTCLRRCYGAVIVKNDRILSTGYNGAPRGAINCSDAKVCYRKENHIPSGAHYELCRSVHAEANAIIHADYSDLEGSTLYLYGFEADSKMEIIAPECCLMCQREVANAGISEVVCYDEGHEIKRTSVHKFIRILDKMVEDTEKLIEKANISRLEGDCPVADKE